MAMTNFTAADMRPKAEKPAVNSTTAKAPTKKEKKSGFKGAGASVEAPAGGAGE